MMKDKNIVVWFSCGVASAVAAKKTIELYGKSNNVFILNTPVKEEHIDNIRFLNDCELWFGQKIVSVVNSKFKNSSIVEVFDLRKYMSGIKGAPCTGLLKKGARYEYELNNKIDYHVFGFTIDELNRHERFIKFERENVIPVLIDLKYTKGKCFEIVEEVGLKLPLVYKMGFPNANCIGCVKSSSPTYWNLVRLKFPMIFEERALQSRRLGVKLVELKGKRIFLDELKINDIGGKIKSWECGLFCDSD